MTESDREAEVAKLAQAVCDFTHDTDLLKFEEESKLQGLPATVLESDDALSERSARENLEAMDGQDGFGYDE
jgi:hypothetical protein